MAYGSADVCEAQPARPIAERLNNTEAGLERTLGKLRSLLARIESMPPTEMSKGNVAQINRTLMDQMSAVLSLAAAAEDLVDHISTLI